MRGGALLAAAGACAALAVSAMVWPPCIIWNASRSVPTGLYGIVSTAPRRDELALIRLPPDLAGLANRRGYLHGTDYVLKPVAAIAGDTVCRFDYIITVSGRIAALAMRRDGAHRPMPAWSGCHLLRPGELFLLSSPTDSFDSRYFGPVADTQVIGRAQPLWTFPNTVD